MLCLLSVSDAFNTHVSAAFYESYR